MTESEIVSADHLSTIMNFLKILLEGYFLYRFAKPFCRHKKAAVSAGGIGYVLAMLFIYILPRHFNLLSAYGISIFTAFLLLCFIERGDFAKNIFLIVTYSALLLFAFSITDVIYDETYRYLTGTKYMLAHPDQWLLLYAGVWVLYLLLESFVLSVSIWFIIKNYIYKAEPVSVKELPLLTASSVMGMLGYAIMRDYRTNYIIENGQKSDTLDFLAFLYYTAAIISIVAVIVLYQNMKARQEEKLHNKLLAAQVESIRQHIEKVESLYQNIRSMKHDMANHILTLERLYEGNKTEEAHAYTANLRSALSEITGEIKSGNPVTDVILQEIKNEAEKRKIQFHSNFYYPPDGNVNAFDVSVILNNALQNALEHAGESENPYISILSYRRNNAYMIEVANSFDGMLQWDTKSDLPVTSKENGQAHTHGYGQAQTHDYGPAHTHGFGLANIRRVAGKYAGDIDITCKDGEFRLTIMLMLPTMC